MERLILPLPLLLLAASGCNDGLQRQPLYGTVTYEGQAVPRGTISFRPDRSRGGTGPAGFAQIVDGEFSTRESGKGAMAGPVEVVVEGYASADPFAPPLFRPHKTAMEISSANEEITIEVPKAEGSRR